MPQLTNEAARSLYEGYQVFQGQTRGQGGTRMSMRDMEDMLISFGQMPSGSHLTSIIWNGGWRIYFSCPGIRSMESGEDFANVPLPHGPVEPQNWPPNG